ncbi:hypothetical protein KM043_014107 [Ampulex compressa]|nr:hypothetical protein KM043_014107 [Ampulex compressa]
MATYLKRTSKLFDLSLSRASADVNLRDLMCPVCRGILIEPVTLPCTHNLCLRCLKGTFEHNSLSCPLCRVRVGSWLRTATKSETLVNNGLWELIQTKFPKEVEDKHNGDDRDIGLDAGFTAANKILSAAGEIRREYEAQLQMAEEEMRCQRKAEQIASEALIRKIQVEEHQQQLAQLAQDQLFAKTLAKRQVVEKHKEIVKGSQEHLNASMSNSSFETSKFNMSSIPDLGATKIDKQGLESGKMNLSDLKDGTDLRRSNIALISKIRAERYANSMKVNPLSAHKDSSIKFCCQKSMPAYNVIASTLKHQAVTKVMQPCTSNYPTEPTPSASKIYGTQCKEELHVPNDVVNSKKKSLGVEVCMTLADDDERIGSAESAGSHDSINQEIHHFKPIKAMPRTPLKLSTDGRQIDPKLIRVVPIIKRTSNIIPKPPAQTHFKRIIGCSWSAFRGKTRQGAREKEVLHRPQDLADELEQMPSTSYDPSPVASSKLTKPMIHDTIRRLDFVPDMSINSNKNYARSTNKIINDTKLSKKLTLEEHTDTGKIHKSWKTHVRNGMVAKYKRQKNFWANKKDRLAIDTKNTDDNDTRNSTLSSASTKNTPEPDRQQDQKDDTALENIAERIKRRKVNTDKKNLHRAPDLQFEPETDVVKRSTRKRIYGKSNVEYSANEETSGNAQKRSKTKRIRNTSRSKSQRAQRSVRTSAESSGKSDSSMEAYSKMSVSSLRKSTRNSKQANVASTDNEQDVISDTATHSKHNYNSSESSCEAQEYVPENNNDSELSLNVAKNSPSDEDIIKEQERIERLVLQEKEDFELARRLQAKFDEMERIAGRTRRSRRAIESENIEVDLYKIEDTPQDEHIAESSEKLRW